jgi:hypothetical protein
MKTNEKPFFFGASWRLTAWLAGLLAIKGVLRRPLPSSVVFQVLQ